MLVLKAGGWRFDAPPSALRLLASDFRLSSPASPWPLDVGRSTFNVGCSPFTPSAFRLLLSDFPPHATRNTKTEHAFLNPQLSTALSPLDFSTLDPFLALYFSLSPLRGTKGDTPKNP
jgi:hypothetical protein